MVAILSIMFLFFIRKYLYKFRKCHLNYLKKIDSALRIKHALLFLAAFTFLHAQDADTAAVSQETETLSLAVFDFAPRGISSFEAQHLTQYLSAQIQQTGRAAVHLENAQANWAKSWT